MTTESFTTEEMARDRIDTQIEARDPPVDHYSLTTVGRSEDDDRYVSGTIEFEPDATAADVASFRRTLPMSFDRTIEAKGGETLVIRLRIE